MSKSHYTPENLVTVDNLVPELHYSLFCEIGAGIFKWFVWNWPITGETAGYIKAKSFPNISKWTEFSSAIIGTFCDKFDIDRIDSEFPLKSGGIKGESENGNLKLKDRYTAEKMYENLNKLANKKKLSIEEIPE
ncbi:17071_t:CDS:2, partial [Funneliformis geosporum]